MVEAIEIRQILSLLETFGWTVRPHVDVLEGL